MYPDTKNKPGSIGVPYYQIETIPTQGTSVGRFEHVFKRKQCEVGCEEYYVNKKTTCW
jgi:hypothetical protein